MMMANNEILGGKWTLDTTDLKAGISEANRLIRLADSEFKATAASMGTWGNQADGVSAKIKSLTSIVDIQEQKVAALRNQHQQIVETSGAHSKAAQELEIVINRETASLNRNKLELDQSQQSYQAIIEKTQETTQKKEELRKKTEELTVSINEMGKKALVALTTAAAAAGAAIGKLMSDSGKFADDLITLSNKTGLSVTQLQELDYAARFVDVSVETMTSSMSMEPCATTKRSFTKPLMPWGR
jgi:chromosome segregation ATPase